MRKETPILADIYPAGTKTCSNCGDKNLSGESFRLKFNFLTPNETLCPDCYKIEDEIQKEKERQRYVDGDEEPNFTDEVTCPWCGYKDMDSGEMDDEDDEYECPECEKIFSYQREIEVTYCSRRVEED